MVGAPPPKVGETKHYSQADLDMIKAATGYNFVVFEGGTGVFDDHGNPAPDNIGRSVQALAAKVSRDRAARLFSGEVTPGYLRSVFAGFAEAEQPIYDGWLDTALAYLAERDAGTASTALPGPAA